MALFTASTTESSISPATRSVSPRAPPGQPQVDAGGAHLAAEGAHTRHLAGDAERERRRPHDHAGCRTAAAASATVGNIWNTLSIRVSLNRVATALLAPATATSRALSATFTAATRAPSPVLSMMVTTDRSITTRVAWRPIQAASMSRKAGAQAASIWL